MKNYLLGFRSSTGCLDTWFTVCAGDRDEALWLGGEIEVETGLTFNYDIVELGAKP